ncbi:hypothetical protein BDW42DRAFT_163361 [Aspergillus taichungensis]|uniref:Uncharacterized protein n=1 Tax=Aspergillus taichungensis TaxID=482145 RepID=A0A2J5I3D4_9EURO|nr:hypothetical protein BDW42DRAFT_163361 [Aspergillus taichungensis]
MSPQKWHALEVCNDTPYHYQESPAFGLSSSLVAEDRGQIQEDLIALFNRQINVEETTLYGDQEMQVPLWNQSQHDAIQCLDQSSYVSLDKCTNQPATSKCVTMKPIGKESPMDCGIDPWSLSPEKLQVFRYALHEQRLHLPRDPSAYQRHSSTVDSPVMEGQLSVYFDMHENRQILSLEMVDVVKDPSKVRPALRTEADSPIEMYLSEDDDLQYAESYMIAGYETLSETL